MSTHWICTRCGGDAVTALASRPSLDDRFAVGHCDRCTPVPVFDPRTNRSKPAVRATVPLAPDSDQVRSEIARRDREAAERKLVEKAMNGDSRLSDADREQAVAIRRRWADEAEARRRA